jgi:hypothetical protein
MRLKLDQNGERVFETALEEKLIDTISVRREFLERIVS